METHYIVLTFLILLQAGGEKSPQIDEDGI